MNIYDMIAIDNKNIIPPSISTEKTEASTTHQVLISHANFRNIREGDESIKEAWNDKGIFHFAPDIFNNQFCTKALAPFLVQFLSE